MSPEAERFLARIVSLGPCRDKEIGEGEREREREREERESQRESARARGESEELESRTIQCFVII